MSRPRLTQSGPISLSPKDLGPVSTSREVAAFLKLSPKNGHKYVERLARNKDLKGKQVGNRWRFTPEHVLDFLRGVK